MISRKADKTFQEKSSMCSLDRTRREKDREGAKGGVWRLERMKRGSGIKGREDKSSGIKILMSDAFAKMNPTEPLRLGKQAARRKRNWPASSGNSLARANASSILQKARSAIINAQKNRSTNSSMSELRENACSVPFRWKVLLSTFETGARGPTVFPPRKTSGCAQMRGTEA